MIIADLSRIEGRRYPARRRTQNLVGAASPIQAANFAIGCVTLDPDGGQVPWHNQEQEEIYFVLEGTGEMCLGDERQVVTAGQAVYIPPGVFHQLTNIAAAPLRMLYCYGPTGDVAHWRQELAGTLPRAGIEAPALPDGGAATMHGETLAMNTDTTTHNVGIILNGVTGRMGTNQHLMRSIVAIIQQGGVKLGANETIMPDPILVGRNAAKLAKLSEQAGGVPWTTNLDEALAAPRYSVYFDAQTTDRRVAAVTQAIAAGKHIYCEKPTATTTAEALGLYRLAKAAGVKNGVVQDKLWLPGLMKLKLLRDTDFFGQIFSVRSEFGYWVFEGDSVPAQRPSWNYRKEDGGGLIIDMLCHFRYVLDNLFGDVQAVSCRGATHVGRRWDESGRPYDCTADDAAYATFELAGGILAHINASWCFRVRRDDLLVFQVDGTKGSAVAGLRDCWIQPYAATPRPTWNPDVDSPLNYFDSWQRLPAQQSYDNAFKVQWELFLRHVVKNEPFRWTLLEGAKGVQLAETGIESWQKRRWVDVSELEA